MVWSTSITQIGASTRRSWTFSGPQGNAESAFFWALWAGPSLGNSRPSVLPRGVQGAAYGEPRAYMRPFAIETQRASELIIDRLHSLASPCQPAAEPLGPGPSAVALWGTDHPCSRVLRPSRRIGGPLQALVHDIRPLRWGSYPTPLRLRRAAEGKTGVGQELILRTRPNPHPVITPPRVTARSKGKPSSHLSRLLQLMLARPGSQPVPRRLASRVGTPELSRASYGSCGAAKRWTTGRQPRTSAG
jgi:hypothetical protein